MRSPEFITRPRLKFLRSVHPEVVEYLESIPSTELSSTISSLLVRAVWDVTGRSHAAIQHQAQAHDPEPKSVHAGNVVRTAETSSQNLEAFGLEEGNLDAFDYS